MNALDLARWQFATTSIYHFLFVPVTIGLAFLVALLQTAWYRNGDDTYRRLARFFGSLLLINVAVGVVTGAYRQHPPPGGREHRRLERRRSRARQSRLVRGKIFQAGAHRSRDSARALPLLARTVRPARGAW